MALPIALAGADQSGVSFARIGGTATVRLELRPLSNIAFNRLARNAVRLENPFKPDDWLVHRGLSGTPWTADPEHSFQRVDPIEFRVPVPTNAKVRRYPLAFAAELFVCDKVVRVCIKRTLEASGALMVSASGRDLPGVLEVGPPVRGTRP